jgi:hypothetical protein
MKITARILNGLSNGTDITFEDVENVNSVATIANKIKRNSREGIYFKINTFPLEGKVRVRVFSKQSDNDNRQRFQGASQDIS